MAQAINGVACEAPFVPFHKTTGQYLEITSQYTAVYDGGEPMEYNQADILSGSEAIEAYECAVPQGCPPLGFSTVELGGGVVGGVIFGVLLYKAWSERWGKKGGES